MEGNYTIGEFARLLGVSPRTVDFYTRQGLLHPEQAGQCHGYRHYTEGDSTRMTLIKQLQACKFSLQEIRQIFNSPGGEKAAAVADVMEQVTTDLDRLKKLIQENLASASAANQPALRLAAAAALQKATGLCSLLVTVMQDTPIL